MGLLSQVQCSISKKRSDLTRGSRRLDARKRIGFCNNGYNVTAMNFECLLYISSQIADKLKV